MPPYVSIRNQNKPTKDNKKVQIYQSIKLVQKILGVSLGKNLKNCGKVL